MTDKGKVIDLPLNRALALKSLQEIIRQLEARIAVLEEGVSSASAKTLREMARDIDKRIYRLEAGLAELTALTVSKKK